MNRVELEKYILDIIVPYIQSTIVFYSDYKSHLQEMVQTERKSLEYVLINETGPAHDLKLEKGICIHIFKCISFGLKCKLIRHQKDRILRHQLTYHIKQKSVSIPVCRSVINVYHKPVL